MEELTIEPTEDTTVTVELEEPAKSGFVAGVAIGAIVIPAAYVGTKRAIRFARTKVASLRAPKVIEAPGSETPSPETVVK